MSATRRPAPTMAEVGANISCMPGRRAGLRSGSPPRRRFLIFPVRTPSKQASIVSKITAGPSNCIISAATPAVFTIEPFGAMLPNKMCRPPVFDRDGHGPNHVSVGAGAFFTMSPSVPVEVFVVRSRPHLLCHFFQNRRDAAHLVNVFDMHVGARRAHLADAGRALGESVEPRHVVVEAGFARERQRVEHGVRRAAIAISRMKALSMAPASFEHAGRAIIVQR